VTAPGVVVELDLPQALQNQRLIEVLAFQLIACCSKATTIAYTRQTAKGEARGWIDLTLGRWAWTLRPASAMMAAKGAQALLERIARDPTWPFPHRPMAVANVLAVESAAVSARLIALQQRFSA
jgi:hypothetical protein